MTNQEVYDIGRRIESFNYINPYDLDNVYIGYLIQVDNVTYQVIVNQHNMIIDPNEKATIFRIEGSSNVTNVNSMNNSIPFPPNMSDYFNDTDDGSSIDSNSLLNKFDDDGNEIINNEHSKNNPNIDYSSFNTPW